MMPYDFSKPLNEKDRQNVFIPKSFGPVDPSITVDSLDQNPSPPPQPNIFQSVIGGLKWYGAHPGQLINEIGQGLSSGLSKTGTFKNNQLAANLNAQSSNPFIANSGKQMQGSLQSQQDFVNSHPVNSVPAMLGEQIPEIPLWMAGEGALAKLAPKALTKATAKLPDFIKGGLKDAATYGAVVAPTESLRDGNNLQQFLDREKQLPGVLAGGVLTRGAGKAFDAGLNTINPIRKIAPELQQAELATNARLQAQNPLQDIQTAYRSPSLHDVKQGEYNQLFSGPDTQFKPAAMQADNPTQYFGKTQSDLESAFPPRQFNQYKFSTGEQRAMNDLTQGMQTAQNYVKHNDILAAYPPGTSIEAAYADVKANTGVDIPKLTENLVVAQNAKTSLTPERLQMGKVAGVIPDLKPRDMLKPQAELSKSQPRLIPPNPGPRQWTNEAQIKNPFNPFDVPKPKVETPSLTPNPVKDPKLSPQIVSSYTKEKTSPMGTLQGIYRQTVNNTQGINQTVKGLDLTGSSNPVVMASNARNAGGTVGHILKHGLTDMSGRTVVDKSISDAFKMPVEKQQAFNEYLFNLHNIDRMREGKPVFASTAESSQKAISDLEAANPEFKQRAEVVRKTLDGLLNEWGVKSGLVSPELRDTLQNMYKNYVPTYRKLTGADAIQFKTRSTGPAKLINKAVGGVDPLIKLDESIPILINKTVKAARKNEVYQGILEAARANPENGYAKVLPGQADESLINAVKNDGIEGIISNSDKALQADPKLGYLLTVMEKGNPVKLQVSKELFDSLNALNKVDDTSLNKALQTVKKYASNPFKSLITGYNPLFAIRNVARDIPTAYIQGTENNPLKFVGNLGTAVKDMATNSPRFQEYKALGGEGGNFFNVEKGLRPEGKLKKVGNAIGAINNFTETLPRYGEYVGTLRRGGEGYSNKMQGLYNAAEVTTNFGRHGDLTKAVDAVVPYLNPAVQGVDKFARTMMNPANVAKAIGVVTVPSAGFYALNQVVDKNGYDQLDNRTKDTYFLIPEGNGKFVKVAKTREAGVLFGALFDRIARTVQGKPDSFKGFGSTVATNFIPNNPIENNIFSPLLYNLPMNKDFAGRDIVPSYMTNDQRSPKLQYDDKTSEIAKKIGDTLNLSPKQIDYLIKSYTGVIGSLALPATTKTGQPISSVISRNFVADPLYNNDIQNNFYSKLDELRRVATDKNLTGNIPPKTVTPEEKQYNDMLKVSKQLSDLRKQQLKAQSNGEQDKVAQLQAMLLEKARQATK